MKANDLLTVLGLVALGFVALAVLRQLNANKAPSGTAAGAWSDDPTDVGRWGAALDNPASVYTLPGHSSNPYMTPPYVGPTVSG